MYARLEVCLLRDKQGGPEMHLRQLLNPPRTFSINFAAVHTARMLVEGKSSIQKITAAE
jgi:hypothetical protein